MEIIKKTISLEPFPKITKRIFTEDTLFFDIETTGFSPRKSDLYLIGVGYRDGEEAVIEQFLADDATEQPQILDRFAKQLHQHSTILTYNGTGFDLPYLKEKLGCDPFASHVIQDLYKDLTPLRAFLGLLNLRQKTLEAFLHITREDTYSGGDLIPIYRHYAATHDDLPKRLLLLHNYEDVLGMLKLIPILSYLTFLEGGYQVSAVLPPSTATGGFVTDESSVRPAGTDQLALRIVLKPADPFPVPIETGYDPFSLAADRDTATLTIQLFRGELKFFFPDPKNYYYLPEEDMAIHRSVGDYVDRAHRIPAKKSNCYTRKAGIFLPQPEEICTPAFRADVKDRLSYFECPENFDLAGDDLCRYINACLRYLSNHKKGASL